MKKIFAIALTLCLMVSALCILTFTALAEESGATQEPAPDVAVRISALKTNGDTEFIQDYTSFETAWNFAVDFARDRTKMQTNKYDRIVVDLYKDWNANDAGEFGDSDGLGFQFSTIYVPDNARMIINMNGHTIDRDLEKWEYDGEVIYIDDADVIINGGKSGDDIIKAGEDADGAKMGTITGGWSCNGAGGIHINEGKVILNNINLTGNSVQDDDGMAIAMYDGAYLEMNGGNIKDNFGDPYFTEIMGGGLYLDNSTAILDGVNIENNQLPGSRYFYGAAVYANNSYVTIKNCKILDNGIEDSVKKYSGSLTTIDANKSVIDISNTEFSNNGFPYNYIGNGDKSRPSAIVSGYKSDITISNDCIFTGNMSSCLLYIDDSSLKISDSIFKDNDSNAFFGNCNDGDIIVKNCVFNNNSFTETINYVTYPESFIIKDSDYDLVFEECDLGNSTFNDKSSVTIKASGDDLKKVDNNQLSSIFGEGSLAMIVAILALVASAVSISLTVVYNKKNAIPVPANNSPESEASADEE